QWPGGQSRKAMEVLVDKLRFGKEPAKVTLLTPIVITKDNLNKAERLGSDVEEDFTTKPRRTRRGRAVAPCLRVPRVRPSAGPRTSFVASWFDFGLIGS
ncbi:MAG TPA: hypothetical protein VE914_09905, partial [Candidatus Angelobacter sp.]|nr:hypothetical protein [Candidatus Angelobacter sp.]